MVARTVAPGKEFVGVNLPKGAKEKLADIAKREGVPNIGETVALLADFYFEVAEKFPHLKDMEEVERRLNERASQIEQMEAELQDANAELIRQVGMSRRAVELMNELIQAGATKADVLAWGEALLASGVDPAEAATLMRKENIGGLLGWAKRIQESIQAAQPILVRLNEEIQSRKLALAEVERRLADTQKRLAGILAEEKRELSNLSDLQSAVAELGLYVDILRAQGATVADLPKLAGRALAGAILMASVAENGDDVLSTGQNVALGRIIPQKMMLSEVPGMLAPDEVYEGMRRAQREREIRAKIIAEQDIPEKGG